MSPHDHSKATARLAEASVDLDRRRRCGFPEVIYGPGKTVEQLCQIVATLFKKGVPVLATRLDEAQAAGLLAAFPQGRHNRVARTFRIASEPSPHPSLKGRGKVAVISAGTGDLPVAEEARETLDWMGVEVTMIHDVGVAGPQRLPARCDRRRCRHGGRAAKCRGRLRVVSGDRRADERRIRGELRWRIGAAVDAQQLRK
jgi:hypothetical protein